MLTHDRTLQDDWILEYVDAWRQRMLDNGGIIPTNIGLDGKIGGACGGKWYGGVYGWGFTVIDPASRDGPSIATPTISRSTASATPTSSPATTATSMSGASRSTRSMPSAKVEDGRTLYPHMYGDQGGTTTGREPYGTASSSSITGRCSETTGAAVPNSGWLAFLEGHNPGYPEAAFAATSPTIRPQGRGDAPRPDDARHPAGRRPDGLQPGDRRRPGPPDAGRASAQAPGRSPPRPASATSTRPPAPRPARRRRRAGRFTHGPLDLARPGQPQSIRSRDLLVQGGGYGEHLCEQVSIDGRSIEVHDSSFRVRLAPGAGGRLTIAMKRYVAQANADTAVGSG